MRQSLMKLNELLALSICLWTTCLAQRRLLPVERKPIQHESRCHSYQWDSSTHNGTFLPWWSCEGNNQTVSQVMNRSPLSHFGSRAEAKRLVNLESCPLFIIWHFPPCISQILSYQPESLQSTTFFIRFFLAGHILLMKPAHQTCHIQVAPFFPPKLYLATRRWWLGRGIRRWHG